MNQRIDGDEGQRLAPAEVFFSRPEIYRFIRSLRRRTQDLLIVVPATAVGLVWELRRSDMRVLPPAWLEMRGRTGAASTTDHIMPSVVAFVSHWVNTSRVAAWLPLLPAIVLYLLLHRRVVMTSASFLEQFDRRPSRQPTLRDGLGLVAGLSLAPLVVVCLSVWMLWDGYGAWTARYVPMLVSVGLVVATRRETRRRRPSLETGLRMPVRFLLSRRGRRLARAIRSQQDAMRSGLGWLTAGHAIDSGEQEPLEEGEQRDAWHHARLRDWLLECVETAGIAAGSGGIAWCAAWVVESCVRTGDLDVAEDSLRLSGDFPGADTEQAHLVAQAMLFEHIGADTVAVELWSRALVGTMRTPLALRRRAIHARNTCALKPGPPASPLQLLRLAWWGDGELLVWYLADRLAYGCDLEAAEAGAKLLETIADIQVFESVVQGDVKYALVCQAKADLFQSIGDAWASRGHVDDAVSNYVRAVESFNTAKDLNGVGRALSLSALTLLPHPTITAHEAERALDLLRVALELLERRRAALRTARARSAVARQDEALHDQVFDVLADDDLCPAHKKAELALWLMESRRHASRDHILADPRLIDDDLLAASWSELQDREAELRVPSPQATGVPLAAWPADLTGLDMSTSSVFEAFTALQAQLPKPNTTYLPRLLHRAGNGVVLMFHTRRTGSAWIIDTVTAAAGAGLNYRRSILLAPAERSEAHPALAALRNGCLALDAIHAKDTATVTRLTRELETDLYAWNEIAKAVLPPGIDQLLTVEGTQVPVLIVVPDGPIAGLPFHGFPVADGRLLGESALVTMTPSLSALKEPSRRPDPAVQRVILHLDRDGLPPDSSTAEDHLWESGDRRLVLSSGRTDLFAALIGEPRADLALIAAHGGSLTSGGAQEETVPRLADGSVLSAATALGLRWPRTVVVATCWVNRIDTAFGNDPVSFTWSCLLRGADTVMGAAGPIGSTAASALFGGATIDHLAGVDLWSALASRLRSGALRNEFGDAATPARGSAIALWSLQPPVTAIDTEFVSAWDHYGVSTTDAEQEQPKATPRSGHLIKLPDASESLVSAMHRAREGTQESDGVLGSRLLAEGIFATDHTRRWVDFRTDAAAGAPIGSAESADEPLGPTTDVALPEGFFIRVTPTGALAFAVAETLRNCRGDKYLLPQHVVYGLLASAEGRQHRWLGVADPPIEGLLESLSAHAFEGDDLPSLSEMGSGSVPPSLDELDREHNGADEVGGGAGLVLHARRLRKNAIAAIALTAVVLGVVLPADEMVAKTPSIGAVVQPQPYRLGTESVVRVMWVMPGGPAARSGIKPGDLLVGYPKDATKPFRALVYRNTGQRLVTLIPVAPRCLVANCTSPQPSDHHQ